MKTKVAVFLWVLGVLVAMLGSSALDAWNKRQEQAKQIEELVLDKLSKICPNPICNCGEECKCGSNCECNLIQEIEEQIRPKDEPAPAPAKPKLIMHSIRGCPPCEADKQNIGRWIETWAVEIHDDTPGENGRLYPWYEVEELDGRRYEFTGQLSPQAIERGRNATHASGR